MEKWNKDFVADDLVSKSFIDIYVERLSTYITNKRYIIFNAVDEPIFSTELYKQLFNFPKQVINKIEQINFAIFDIFNSEIGLLIAYNIGDDYDISENYKFPYTMRISTEKYL